MAKEYKTTPASLLGVDDPYASYCFNEAAYMWGLYVEVKLQESTKGIKDDPDNTKHEQARRQVIDRLLAPEFQQQSLSTTGKFRDPMAVIGKKKS